MLEERGDGVGAVVERGDVERGLAARVRRVHGAAGVAEEGDAAAAARDRRSVEERAGVDRRSRAQQLLQGVGVAARRSREELRGGIVPSERGGGSQMRRVSGGKGAPRPHRAIEATSRVREQPRWNSDRVCMGELRAVASS